MDADVFWIARVLEEGVCAEWSGAVVEIQDKAELIRVGLRCVIYYYAGMVAVRLLADWGHFVLCDGSCYSFCLL